MRYVRILAGVDRDVVKLVSVNQTPAVGFDSRVLPFSRLPTAWALYDEGTVFRVAFFSEQQWFQADAIRIVRSLDATEVENGGEEVNHAGDPRNDFGFGSQKTEHEGDVMSRVVAKSLAVVTMGSPTVVHSLIGGVNQNGVLSQAQFIDLFHHASNVGIEVLDLSIQLNVPLDALSLQLSDQFLRAVVGE